MGPRAVASRLPDVVGKATPDRGGPRKSPDGVDPKTSGWASKRTRKTQRDGHNSGVKIWSLCSVSSILSHANFEQPFRTLAIKREVNIIVKKSSCRFFRRFPSCLCLWCCVVAMLNESEDEYTTQWQFEKKMKSVRYNFNYMFWVKRQILLVQQPLYIS